MPASLLILQAWKHNPKPCANTTQQISLSLKTSTPTSPPPRAPDLQDQIHLPVCNHKNTIINLTITPQIPPEHSHNPTPSTPSKTNPNPNSYSFQSMITIPIPLPPPNSKPIPPSLPPSLPPPHPFHKTQQSIQTLYPETLPSHTIPKIQHTSAKRKHTLITTPRLYTQDPPS